MPDSYCAPAPDPGNRMDLKKAALIFGYEPGTREIALILIAKKIPVLQLNVFVFQSYL